MVALRQYFLAFSFLAVAQILYSMLHNAPFTSYLQKVLFLEMNVSSHSARTSGAGETAHS